MSGKWFLLARMGYHIVAPRVLCPDWFFDRVARHAFAVAGTTLMLMAIGLRAWSMQTLGERFRGYEVRAEPRGLETRGPYALVRHPGYLAFVLFDIGMPLLLNGARLLPLLVVPLAVMLRRVSAEERLLLEGLSGRLSPLCCEDETHCSHDLLGVLRFPWFRGWFLFPLLPWHPRRREGGGIPNYPRKIGRTRNEVLGLNQELVSHRPLSASLENLPTRNSTPRILSLKAPQEGSAALPC